MTVESVSGGSTLTYAYDRNGNRASLRATGSEYYTVLYDYDAANRLLSETRSGSGTISSTLYTYDANGNMLTISQSSAGFFARVEENAYNGFGQLVSQCVSADGVTTNLAFGYYPDGIRSVKLVNSTPIYYAVNNGYVSAEYYGDDLTAVYLWGANLIKGEIGSDTNYYLYNAHGDVIQLADEIGSVVYEYTYDAFGVEDEPDSHDTNPFRYCGEYFDRESGKYYLRARYYDPKLGRFTQEDSVRSLSRKLPNDQSVIQSSSLNLYSYCSNDPISSVDPSGHTGELALTWTSGMWWLCAIDGPIPIGDAIYIAGIGAMSIADAINTFGMDNVVRLISDAPNSIGDNIKNAVSWIKDKATKASNWVVENFGGSSTQPPNDPNNWNHREYLLKQAQDNKLKRIISELYRKDASIGDGGTADMLRYEYDNGLKLKHLQKTQDRIAALTKLIDLGELCESDLKLAYNLLNDLYNAVKYVS